MNKDSDLYFRVATDHPMFGIIRSFHTYEGYYLACFQGWGYTTVQSKAYLLNFIGFWDIKKYYLSQLN